MNPAVRGLVVAWMLGAPLSAFGADVAKDPLTGGDPAGGTTKAAVCAACHGPAGKSAVPEWPKLAGQGSVYTYKQLEHFKCATLAADQQKAQKCEPRMDPVMSPQAAALSEQDMKDVAAYFAAQPLAPGVASKDAVAIAEPIYRGGIPDRKVPACLACHGPTGAGNAAAGYPRIGGQHATYTADELRRYRAGERKAGLNGQMMSAVAAGLSDQEIDALASYLNGLQ